MAHRPVFISNIDINGYVEEKIINFTWFAGLSKSQKQKSIKSLHDSFSEENPEMNILEISSKSTNLLGVNLSAFNLSFIHQDKKLCVENAFQGSKVFQNGGPYLDLLQKSAIFAKRDFRLKNSGPLIEFTFSNHKWPLEPKTAFYDWLYINALNQNLDLRGEILKYSAFTDIEYNPLKSINCQAKSAALFISLNKKGILEKVLKSPEKFIEIYNKT